MNIREIACRAGVSRSTVSYTLSGKRPVSAETRRRVQTVLDELGYQHTVNARALKEDRACTLALVIPPASQRLTGMQLEFVASVVEEASRSGLDVLLSPSDGDHDRSFERIVKGRRADGVVLMEVRLEDARVTRLQQIGLPFVAIGRIADPTGTCWVDMDYARLVSRCVHHLADLGHRRIALVNRSTELAVSGYGPAHRAHSGFYTAAIKRGVTGIDVCCNDSPIAGQQCAEQLLAADPGLTALVTINEAALQGIQRGVQRAGRHIPRSFSIAGVAGRRWAEDCQPPLTAADVPAAELGTEAVRLLLERISSPQTPMRHLLLAPPISVRFSTGPVRPR